MPQNGSETKGSRLRAGVKRKAVRTLGQGTIRGSCMIHSLPGNTQESSNRLREWVLNIRIRRAHDLSVTRNSCAAFLNLGSLDHPI